MNIFMLDYNPKLSAQFHNDKHVVKMIVEYAQLLSTAHRILDGKEEEVRYQTKTGSFRKKKVFSLVDNTLNTSIYAAAHVNHPSSIWVRESKSNYNWLHEMSLHLVEEYKIRYGNKKHKTESVLINLFKVPSNINDHGFTLLKLAMPEKFHKTCPVESYRDYYRTDKEHLANWKTNKPYWF